MQNGRIPGATRVLGKSQGYLGLAIRDQEMLDKAENKIVNSMTSAWLPTPKELQILNAGGAVHVTIFGLDHPPMLVSCGDPPE